MAMSLEVQQRIHVYLWDIAAHLPALESAERAELLQNVEAHIYEALRERTATPTVADVDAVLAAMPAPAAYADDAGAALQAASSSRLTWNAVPGAVVDTGQGIGTRVQQFAWEGPVGMAVTVLGILVAFWGCGLTFFGHFFSGAASAAGAPQPIVSGGGFFAVIGGLLLALALGCFATAVGLGRRGIRRIDESDGQMQGLGWAFAAHIAFPLILLDAIVFFLLFHLFGGASLGAPVTLLTVLSLLVVFIIDYYLVQYEWRRVTFGMERAPSDTPL